MDGGTIDIDTHNNEHSPMFRQMGRRPLGGLADPDIKRVRKRVGSEHLVGRR